MSGSLRNSTVSPTTFRIPGSVTASESYGSVNKSHSPGTGSATASHSPSLSDASSLSSEQHVPQSCSCISDNMYFKVSKHSKDALEIMQMLRMSRKLCDVILRVNGDELYAHKIVLASASPYFSAMFTSGMREERSHVVTLHGIRPSILGMLINFAYTSEIVINSKNVWHILPSATMLQMNHVIEACSLFLERHLTDKTCIDITEFAAEYGCLDLQRKATDFVYKNFSDVFVADSFLKLEGYQLMKLLESDEIRVKCEYDVYDSVCRWIMHDEDSRIDFLEDLLRVVRCHYIPPKNFEMLLKFCPLLKQNKRAKTYMKRIFQEISVPKPASTRFWPKPRKSCTLAAIYVAGGYFRQSLTDFAYFLPCTGAWRHLIPLPTPRSGMGICVVHGQVYVFGGRNCGPDWNRDLDSLDIYDPLSNTWRAGPVMSVARGRVGVGILNGVIYAIGGSCSTNYHSTAEKLDVTLDRWQKIASMSQNRIGVSVVGINGLLYAIGGFDGTNRLRSVEMYNPQKDKWTNVVSLKTARSGAGTAALGGYIYAAGGFDGSTQLRTVERYCIIKCRWGKVADMNTPRSAMSLAVFKGKLYAFGGFDGVRFLSSVECYDPESGTWTEVTSMESGKSGHGCAIGIEPCISNTTE